MNQSKRFFLTFFVFCVIIVLEGKKNGDTQKGVMHMARITKREHFEAILAILEGTDNADLANFVTGEIALIDKRKSAPRKPTSEQLKNAEIKLDIVAVLENADEPMRATEVATVLGFTVQKVTALMRQLVENGTVIREVDGKVTTFRLP